MRDRAESLRVFPARHPFVSAAALGSLVAALFARTLWFGYIPLDDVDYVRQVRNAGTLNAASVRWAFASFEQANWHPLTWLSYLLDASLFGISPRAFHATNVALHAAAAAVLFLAFRSLSGAPWRSLLVGALFGIHPLHVESVAWVSERKDVLSGLCFAAMLLAWSRYVRAGGIGRYSLVVALFAFGLLAKPMLVTAPFVLLLLDVWPLGRTSLAPPSCEERERSSVARLFWEKGPLFLLAAASVAVTLVAQGAGGAFSEVAPFADRAENAVVAVAGYLRRAVWPSGLAVFYPYRVGSVSMAALATSAGTILGATAIAVWQLRTRPWIAVGWCWYLGMLVPVLGLVQVGGQAAADRYTYLPLVGIFVVFAWAAGEVASLARHPLRAAAAVGLAPVVALAVATVGQVHRWRDGTALFEHAAAVTEGNWVAHDILGTLALERGERDRAGRHFLESIRLNSQYAEAHFHLGLLFSEEGDPADAVTAFRRATELSPGSPMLHAYLGSALYLAGRRDEAMAQYREALRLDPACARAADGLRAIGAP
ncbi:MAG TPA: tetratricopeptide repeat protein [Anaeromyxobacteraceae bacterium]|nr:tetratricopeptide repeat protein [Anaeromyxobacteraceae bacterium]